MFKVHDHIEYNITTACDCIDFNTDTRFTES